MVSMFRSQEMSLCQLFLQSEAAYACVSELGELGLVQFRDLNPNVNAFQRKFVSEVRRCEEMERKLRYVEKEMKKDGLTMVEVADSPKAPFPREMIDLEAAFEKLETELREVNTNAEALKRNYLELSELREVLKKTQTFFAEQGEDHHTIVQDAQHALVQEEAVVSQSVMQLGFVAGVISRERMPAFERILWFACRGNVFLKMDEIAQPLEDPHTGNEMYKCVFIIFFQGEQLKARVRKICDGYKATLYPCPESSQERQEMLNGVSVRLEDLRHVLEQTKEHRGRVLKKASKEIQYWILKARKIKAIYHTLNMANFDVSHNSLIAECWCPVAALDKIKFALSMGTEASGSTVPSILHRMETTEDPPTYQATNIFTQGFQNIVDAYGVANYREVNPALYTIITFPFLFAVMFGDAGHGLIMFLFGLFMIVREKSFLAQKTDNEIWNTFFGGRYIIMLMGLFSIYTGFLYNDIFAKSCNIFGSSWHPNYTLSEYKTNDILMMNPAVAFKTHDQYPFGVDPVWAMSINKITFLNSFKMKVAVILGILQMLFGVMLSLANHIHFRKYLDIFCEFIPEMIFLLAIFGYLVATIFFKWITYDVSRTQEAPSLLIHLINMFLMKYSTDEKTPPSQRPYYDNQQTAQTTLLVLAVICIPWLLLPKPFILRYLHKRKLRFSMHAMSTEGLVQHEVSPHTDAIVNEVSITITTNTEDLANGKEPSTVIMSHVEEVHLEIKGHNEIFEFGEVFIHQAIHTIEYCLGCISNTASYLRLWALSLAHAQLSDVLWTMVFRIALSLDGYLGLAGVVVLFAFWAVLTIAVLLLMEGLSAFLHALRLHWVEFQNKFYFGQGHQFLPFTFKNIMELSSSTDLKD